MSHVSTKMLNGKTVGTASIDELRHAMNRIGKMSANIKASRDLSTVSSNTRWRANMATSEHGDLKPHQERVFR